MPNDIVLTLASPEAMFASPAPDPLAPGFALTSGIDRVMAEMTARPVTQRQGGRIVIRNAGATPLRDSGWMGAAVAAWCTARGAELTLEKARVWQEGMKTLWLSAIFIAACVAVSAILSGWLEGPGILAMLMRDGLVIAGWVALWRPIDLLLFETWLLRRQARVLAAVAAMPVVVEAGV